MAHMKRSRMIMIPFIIMFIWGVFLIMRPCQQVQITKVVDTYTKRESKGTKSSRTYKTVAYAVVEVDYNGETATVTGLPLKRVLSINSARRQKLTEVNTSSL